MEIESRKRHFNEDTSKKVRENLALREDLENPKQTQLDQGQVFHKKDKKSGMIQESMSVCKSHFRHAL